MVILKKVSLDKMPEMAAEVISLSGKVRIWKFIGNLGAGKTTLIKEICKLLGVKDQVQSPTFSLVNVYSAAEGEIYHFDLYRLKNEEEAYDFGMEEYLDSGKLCLIEWPETIESLLPLPQLVINISADEAETRTIDVEIIS